MHSETVTRNRDRHGSSAGAGSDSRVGQRHAGDGRRVLRVCGYDHRPRAQLSHRRERERLRTVVPRPGHRRVLPEREGGNPDVPVQVLAVP